MKQPLAIDYWPWNSGAGFGYHRSTVLTSQSNLTDRVSSLQGLTIKTSISQNGIIGIAVAILVCLFLMQSFGTRRVSFMFSPVVVLWLR